LPHHGSKTSSTAPFIDAVSPEVALFSVGYRNRFRHPNEAVVARYAQRGIVLRRTDAEGALHVRLPAESGGAITVQGQGPACRYWTERSCH
jgi:competence protein ComEC